MKITAGKEKGMQAVSNSNGVIAAAAMDQRGSLRNAIAKERGVDKKEVTDQMLEEFKTCVTRVLTPHASAILLDPEFGLPAAKARSKNAGLLLAYENSGYDNTQPGRLPDLLDIWSVRRLCAAGADCIKILLYYNPFDAAKINDIKHAWVERIGSECKAEDVPFFLEFVTYEEGKDEKTVEYARKKPEPRHGQHERILEAAIWRRRSQGGSAYQHEIRSWHAVVQGRIRLYARRGQRPLPQGRRSGAAPLHLSFGRRHQRCLQRNARARRRGGSEFLRSSLWPRHLVRRHSRLRQKRRESTRGLA